MGILDRILAGMPGHGSSHGHGNSRGHGSPSSHDWGHNPAPSVSGITCPAMQSDQSERRSLLRPVRDIAGASVVHEVQ
jgi:hypothetical protein